MQKSCPHCGASFLCQPDQPTLCQCAGVVLSDNARAEIQHLYPGKCLCRNCLIHIASTSK